MKTITEITQFFDSYDKDILSEKIDVIKSFPNNKWAIFIKGNDLIISNNEIDFMYHEIEIVEYISKQKVFIPQPDYVIDVSSEFGIIKTASSFADYVKSSTTTNIMKTWIEHEHYTNPFLINIYTIDNYIDELPDLISDYKSKLRPDGRGGVAESSTLSVAFIPFLKTLSTLLKNAKYKNLFLEKRKNFNTPIFNIEKNNLVFNTSDFPENNPTADRYLLAKPFVILTGNSGTGKTRIATDFAKWLEKKSDTGITNHLTVPVGADWTDNTKILGYFNPLANNGTGEYVKSDILSFIELAGSNTSIPFFLILDEMNLSHVERYFSDFLSAMESGEPILLYKKPEGCESTVPEKIKLPNNLFVTGTVNIDETTYMFSPKVLDRANVIEFVPEKENILKIFKEKQKSEETDIAPAGMAEAFMTMANNVRNFENGPTTDYQPSLLKVFGELYDILKKAGFEFAYRTTIEITRYLCAARSLDSNADFWNIADEQIVQKLLPKIHGNKKQIGQLLSELREYFEKESELTLSLEKTKQMIDRLDKLQYASFI